MNQHNSLVRQRGAAEQIRIMIFIGLLFFLFGSVTWLNGSLIPYLKIVCRLDSSQSLLVTFAFYISYTVMALPMAGVLERTGYRAGMMVGLGIMALAALIHIPAALFASYPLFLLALFTLGTGLTVLQTASNPYLVLLGPIEGATRRISIMGIVNKSAGVLVPLAFTAFIFTDLGPAEPSVADSMRLAHKLIAPYCAMAVILVGLIGLIRFADLPEITPAPAPSHQPAGRGLASNPQLVLGAIALFGYMGVEVMAGDTIGLFGQSLGVRSYTLLTSYTMAAMVLGYALGIICVPRLINQRTALAVCGGSGLVAVIGILTTSAHSDAIAHLVWGWSGIPPIPDPLFCVAAMGLAHALVWPLLWPLALADLGRHTARASAVLIMAISGGAVLPLLFGWIGTHVTNLQNAYALALPCYAMLVFYAVKGAGLRAWRGES